MTALCASSQARAERVAERLGIPNASGDWRELVADPGLAAIAVATPPAIQPAIVKAALASHKHVFCEKPLATTREVAAELLVAARQAGVAHMVDFEFPMIPAWQQAKERLDRGAIGQVRHALVCWQFETYARRAGLSSWKTRTEEGGGTVNLFVSHAFYYLEWLLGPIQSLSARLFPQEGRADDPARGETLAILCLLLRSGVPVSVTVNSHTAFGTGHRVELYGERGTLIVENPTSDYMRGFQLWEGSRGAGRLTAVPVPEEPQVEGDSRIAAVSHLVQRFVDWIDRGIPSRPSVEDGYRVQCLLDAAYEADRSGRWVTVAETPPPPPATAGAPRVFSSPAVAQ